MPEDRVAAFGFLNVVATPHPDGVYERLLNVAANIPVQFWGSYYAAISKPKGSSEDPELLIGRLLVWVEIDPREPAINKQKLEEVNLDENNAKVAKEYGFNLRVHNYIFDLKSHVLTIELKNEPGQIISMSRIKRIFDRLFSPEILGRESELVETTVIPDDDALAQVLGFSRLDKVDINVKRPNEDDVIKETNEVLEELLGQNAQKQEVILTRAPKTDGIQLNDRNKKLARVAANNGYVTATGRMNDQRLTDKRSTKEYPKIIKYTIDGSHTILGALRAAAKAVRLHLDKS